MAATLGARKRKTVLDVVGHTEGEAGPGPVKALLDKEAFDEIHLLSNYPPNVTKLFVDWLKRRALSHQVTLANPSNHGEILAAVQRVLASLELTKNDELCFHLSPGTPAMASIWILLGKSQYPATLFQTHRDKVWTTDIPFDITTDVLPQILRGSDRLWQHLATKSPQEVRGFESIIGESPAIRLATGRAQRAAIHDVPVLILGESGTGKEMFAEAIHLASHRRGNRFVAINCAAISRELLESELFGHVKGAFTGADKARDGAFAQADGGTLFLDEVGECDLAMQAKLLRALQPPHNRGPCCRVFRPVGAVKDVNADVRIVAATNRDLNEAIEQGHFREDLLYRLSTITLKLPSLRDREGDILLLAEALLKETNARFRQQNPEFHHNKWLSGEAKMFVQRFNWPGNVRELSNALTQAVVMSNDATIEAHDIAAAIAEFPGRRINNVLDCPLGGSFCIERQLEDIQRRFIRRAMEESGGRVTKAAKLLGMRNYQTLAAQIERLQIECGTETA